MNDDKKPNEEQWVKKQNQSEPRYWITRRMRFIAFNASYELVTNSGKAANDEVNQAWRIAA